MSKKDVVRYGLKHGEIVTSL